MNGITRVLGGMLCVLGLGIFIGAIGATHMHTGVKIVAVIGGMFAAFYGGVLAITGSDRGD